MLSSDFLDCLKSLIGQTIIDVEARTDESEEEEEVVLTLTNGKRVFLLVLAIASCSSVDRIGIYED